MADQINVFQALGQVEGELEPKLKVSQTVGQVEWELEPKLKTSQIIGQVEVLINLAGIYVCQLLVQVEYLEEAGPGPETSRIFPVLNPKTVWQSQAGKRKFPVVIGAS